MKRRTFLEYTSLASTSLFVPSFLASPFGKKTERSRSGRNLVIIQLNGGNDGLNTVIPYRNDVYYRERPRLAIPRQEALTITDELAFHPAMDALRPIYDQGQLAVLHDVGYPNPDRSHFRSMDIWHTASGADEYRSEGWLGRYLDNHCTGCEAPYHALEIDDSLSLALKGAKRTGFAMSNPDRLQRATENQFLKALGDHQGDDHNHEEVSYLYKTMIDTQRSARYLYEQAGKHRNTVPYPANRFGDDLALIAKLILADTDTRIYYAGLTGFDTHANQQGAQQRLLQQYADGVSAFVRELEEHDLLDDTLILTFSEFGRRVAQNGSNGTDHGAANNLFLMGGNLKQRGFVNGGPDLQNLLDGDLQYRIDFRSVYATVLDHWLETDADAVLGGRFDRLKVV
jgi:uncharacterized protein (DUF1501 family)